MNLPNRLTLLRIAMVPLYLILMSVEGSTWRALAAVVFFLAASTDYLDGYLARKHGLVTNLGKFLDPIADKLLVGSAMIWLCAAQALSPWLVILVIAREFVVSGLRLVAAAQGLILAAGPLGKAKTVCQMFLVMALTLSVDVLANPLIWLTALLTLWSGMDYLWRNREVFREGERP